MPITKNSNERGDKTKNTAKCSIYRYSCPNALLRLCQYWEAFTLFSITSNITAHLISSPKNCLVSTSPTVGRNTHLPLRLSSLVITHNKNIITCIVHDARDTDLRAEQKAGPAAI